MHFQCKRGSVSGAGPGAAHHVRRALPFHWTAAPGGAYSGCVTIQAVFPKSSGGRPSMATRSTPAAPSAPNYLVRLLSSPACFYLRVPDQSEQQPVGQARRHLQSQPRLVEPGHFGVVLRLSVFSVPSAKLIEKVGYKRTMVKVISARPDEGGGCQQTHPKDAVAELSR